MDSTSFPRKRTIEPHARRVDKPWGWEILWADTPWYVGKLLHVRTGQRLSLHEHPEAVAQALREVPRSRPFERLDELAALPMPVTIVASRDEADPGHPLSVGEAYARTIPGARLLTEDEGSSPLAWQGGQLSRAIAESVSG